MWVNEYKACGDITNWNYMDGFGVKCVGKRRVGIFDLAVRFADIDGNSRADNLCIEKNTRTTAFLNHATGQGYVGQVKFPIERDRGNINWADVNGTGRAD